MQKRLGKAEHKVLLLIRDKSWRSGDGVLYNNLQQSTRVLDNLCKKGYAKKDIDKRPHHLLGDSVYTITQAGINRLAEDHD